MSLEDGAAISLLPMQESVLRNPHVAVDVMQQRDRQLGDGMKSDEAAAARKGFQRGETAVAGPEQVHQLARPDARCAAFRGLGDGRLLRLLQLLEQPLGNPEVLDHAVAVLRAPGSGMAISARNAASTSWASPACRDASSSNARPGPSTVTRDSEPALTPRSEAASKRVAVSMSAGSTPTLRNSSWRCLTESPRASEGASISV